MTDLELSLHGLPDDMIPGWSEWRAVGSTFDAFAYAEMSLGKLMLASRLFWPTFSVYRDCLFLADGFAATKVDTWWTHESGDLGRVEQICNHRLVTDMVGDTEPKVPGEHVAALGRIMRSTWQAAVDAFVGAPGIYLAIGTYRDDAEDFALTIRRADVEGTACSGRSSD